MRLPVSCIPDIESVGGAEDGGLFVYDNIIFHWFLKEFDDEEIMNSLRCIYYSQKLNNRSTHCARSESDNNIMVK
jgi:hypothetical protein